MMMDDETGDQLTLTDDYPNAVDQEPNEGG